MKLILTSSGLTNRKFAKIFIDYIGKDPKNIKVLFIPVAASSVEAIAALPKSIYNIIKAGIPKINITVCDLHEKMTYESLSQYDAVYFCEGDGSYLLERINETEFNVVLKKFVENNKVFIGEGEGSLIAAENFPNNLGFANCKLTVHCDKGSKAGKVINTKNCPNISLANNQALVIEDKKGQIVE